MKKLLTTIFIFFLNLSLFAHHKPGHTKGGGNGNNVPEMDEFGIFAVSLVIISIYLIYYNSSRKQNTLEN